MNQAPPSYEYSTMEDEQACHMNNGRDTSSLIPRKEHVPTSAPPAYAPPPNGGAPVAPFSNAQWPAGGGYAGPMQQPQGHAMMMQQPVHGHAVPVQGQHTTVVLASPPSVVVTQRCESPWRTYLKVRMAICCGVIVVKVVIIAIVVIVILAASASGSGSSHEDDYDDY